MLANLGYSFGSSELVLEDILSYTHFFTSSLAVLSTTLMNGFDYWYFVALWLFSVID